MQRGCFSVHMSVFTRAPRAGSGLFWPAEVRILDEPRLRHSTRHGGGKIKRRGTRTHGGELLGAHIDTHTRKPKRRQFGSRTQAGTPRGSALACHGGTGSGESVAYVLPARAGVHDSRTKTGSCRKMMTQRPDRG
jgi:hypothetical protein